MRCTRTLTEMSESGTETVFTWWTDYFVANHCAYKISIRYSMYRRMETLEFQKPFNRQLWHRSMPDTRVWEGQAYEYLSPLTLPVVVFQKTRMYICISIISKRWFGRGGWNPSNWMIWTCVTTVHTMADDSLTTQWVRVSETTASSWIFRNDPTSAL